MSDLPARAKRFPHLLLLLAALFLVSCYEVHPILRLLASPDGRFIAIAYKSGELAVLDLDHPENLPIYSTALEDANFAWSPDSRRLAFVERPPASLSQIWTVDPREGRASEPLVTGIDWKAQPEWISNNELYFLSDRDADHVSLWSVNVITGEEEEVFDPGRDIARLWGHAGADIAIASVVESDGTTLWLLAGDAEPLELSLPADLAAADFEHLAFAPDGAAFAAAVIGVPVSEGGEETETLSQIFYYDLAARDVLGRIQGEQIPTAITVGLPQSLAPEVDAKTTAPRPQPVSVLIASGGWIHHWVPALMIDDPENPAGADNEDEENSSILDPIRWKGLPLAEPVWLGDRGWAAALNDDLLVTAPTFEALRDGKIHARTFDALAGLAQAAVVVAEPRDSRRVLSDMWDAADLMPDGGFAVALARSQVELLDNNESRAEEWLLRAIERAESDNPVLDAAWVERLLIQFLDRGRERGALELIEAMPPGPRSAPVTLWVEDLLGSEDHSHRARWQRIGRELRDADWDDAAERLADLLDEEPGERTHVQGLALLLRGDLEPLSVFLTGQPPSYRELLAQTPLQRTLLDLSRRELGAAMGEEELRGLLLLEWAKAGQIDPAIQLVRIDLRDPEGSALDFDEILDRYLEPEEQDAWIERAVGEILLSPEVALLLEGDMENPRDRLVLALARIKHALIADDLSRAETGLLELQRRLVELDADFWSRDTAHLRLLTRIYQAKVFERREQWDAALRAYADARDVLLAYPRDWGVVAYDVGWARALLQAGRSDPERLSRFLGIVRDFGDPLVNPLHQTDEILAVEDRLRDLLAEDPPAWLEPFAHYAYALLLEQKNRPFMALAHLDRALIPSAPAGLRHRVLLEEAAVRGSLEQHRLAALVLTRLSESDLPAPELTSAISSRAEAESQWGMLSSQENRMRYLVHEFSLPRPWARTLIADHSILPPGDLLFSEDLLAGDGDSPTPEI